jgi:hypothetical protein
MKKLSVLIAIIFLLMPFRAGAVPRGEALAGRILLQVENNGEAWYVSPVNRQRYFLGRPADAFFIMRQSGLGISNRDFDGLGRRELGRLAGRIILKVEDKGKAYYINPVDLGVHYMGRPDDAFRVMRELGLGISNINLAQIKTAPDSLGKELYLYFINPKFDSFLAGCEECHPTPRVYYNNQTVDLLRELLGGPNDKEAAKGYFTAIAPGAKVLSFGIENGVAMIDFDQSFSESLDNSCRSAAVQSQIRNTVVQLPGVKALRLSMNGRPLHEIE